MTNKTFTSVSSRAPGKYIIIGEHAVVHGEPALVAPLGSLSSIATINPAQPNGSKGLSITAPDINLSEYLHSLHQNNPIADIVRRTLLAINYYDSLSANLTITSTIPIASGLGSSASVSTAISRSIVKFFNIHLTDNEISDIVYKTEALQHGNPSGIDNTVIAHEVPMLYSKVSPPKHLRPAQSLYYVLADSKYPSHTITTVDSFSKQRLLQSTLFDRNIRKIGKLARSASIAFQDGDHTKLGALMTKNHILLQQLGVSTKQLDKLVNIAIEAGAKGAKLSGAGHGGHIIAQVSKQTMLTVANALKETGTNPLTAIIKPHSHE